MNASPATQRGSTLLESLIAILVFSFGVLGMVGLQAASIKSISEAKYRTDAAFLANELIGQMWAERATITTDYEAPDDWTERVASTLPGGTGSVERKGLRPSAAAPSCRSCAFFARLREMKPISIPAPSVKKARSMTMLKSMAVLRWMAQGKANRSPTVP